MTPVYVVHPVELRLPMLSSFKADVQEVVVAEQSWRDFQIVWIPMGADNGFRVSDVTSRVRENVGPVVIFDVAQRPARETLRLQLESKTVVIVTTGADSTTLWHDLETARKQYESREPHLPRKLVVAVLLMRKFIKEKFWGGGNEKRFMWADELANGRGVDDSYKDVAREVANVLMLRGLLQPKYGGKKPKKQHQKFALNPDRRSDIMALASDCSCSDSELIRVLRRDTRLISARELDGWEDPA